MAFEITVISNVPLTPLKDRREVVLTFLQQIGYLSRGRERSRSVRDFEERVPYRLFVECLLERMERGRTVEEMASKLGTTKATIYRHISKLKLLDLLEEVDVQTPEGPRKGYRIRYGNLAKAWNFVEAHVEVAMKNYRETVDHLQSLVGGGYSRA